MTTPLFAVIIDVAGTDEGTGVYDVTVVDRYHDDVDTVIGEKTDMRSLDEAMEFAKGAVTAFWKEPRK
jgi:hypothetical protein